MLGDVWGFISNIYMTLGGFVIDPTGSIPLNILFWVFTYAAGWYAATLGIVGYELKNNDAGLEYRCSVQSNLSEYNCSYNHGDDCWGPVRGTISEHTKVDIAKRSMGLATLWPLVMGALILGGPIAGVVLLFWFALARPLALGSKAVGEAIVAGTVAGVDHGVNYVVKRQEDIDKHKALESKKD